MNARSTSLAGSRTRTRSETRSSFKPRLERLEDRCLPAVTAFFSFGVLAINGDANANDIRVTANDQGTIQVLANGRQVAIVGGTATTSNTTLVNVAGKAGNDRLVVDNSLGSIQASIVGGAGSDFLQAGRGNSLLDGGAGSDTLVSGFGRDVMLGGAGHDLLRWDPGTIDDLMEGGDGVDTVLVIGNDTFQGQPAGDSFRVTANGSRLRFDRLNLVPFALDIGTVENLVLQPAAGDDLVVIGDLTGVAHLRSIVVQAGDGDDRIDASAQANPLVQLTLQGDAGNDVVIGSRGNDRILGGDGNDQLSGGDGLDRLDGGAGDDLLDGGKDGRLDLLAGGLGSDRFVRYLRRANPRAALRFDEVLVDYRAGEDVFVDGDAPVIPDPPSGGGDGPGDSGPPSNS